MYLILTTRNDEVNKRREREIQNHLKMEKESRNKEILATLRTQMSKEQLRCNDEAQIKGASSWLNALNSKINNFCFRRESVLIP